MASIDNFEYAHKHRHDVVWMTQNTNAIPMPRHIRDAILRSVEEAEYTAHTGANPDEIEERLLRDHKIHVRAGGYLSKTHGSKFVRVSFAIPTDQCGRFRRRSGS